MMVELMMKNVVTNKRKIFSIQGKLKAFTAILFFVCSGATLATTLDEDIQQLSDSWAHVNFELNDDKQEDAFINLSNKPKK